MTRRALTFWTATAALTLAVSPAWARQAKERPPAGESRPSNGNTTGSAAPRSGGGESGGSGGSASSSSAGSSGQGSSFGVPSGDRSSSGGGFAPRAPERRGDAQSRDRAVQRGDSSGRPAAAQGRASASAPNGDGGGGDRRAVPAYSRPRDGRQPVGSAAVRQGPPPDRNDNRGGRGYYYDPYYYGSPYGYGYGNYYGYGFGNYGYGRWMPGYGFGLGYFYDPFLYGGYSPYDYDYGYGGSGQGYSERYSRRGPTGQLRLKVKPEHGQVYVDGYYVGEVDSFDGVFQRMPIEAGSHRIEIRAAGYQSVVFDVMVSPGETVTYKGELKTIR
jgi:hypothetical protein